MNDAAVVAEMKALAALAWDVLTPDEQAEWTRIEGRGGQATLGQRRRMRQLRARIAASRTPEVEERLCDLAERLALPWHLYEHGTASYQTGIQRSMCCVPVCRLRRGS